MWNRKEKNCENKNLKHDYAITTQKTKLKQENNVKQMSANEEN